MQWLTDRLANPDVPGSLSARARSRRWSTFARLFPDLPEMRVVDLGGTPQSWLRDGKHPLELVSVNLFPQTSSANWNRIVVADACDLPGDLLKERFDLVFSNSVIEHVGGHFRRAAFAEAVHRLADRHWVQTPYRYSLVEPHWLFPGFAHLPVRVRAELTRRWPLGHRRAEALVNAVENVLTVELLSRTEMRHYFPNSEIISERVLALPKSMVAVKGADASAIPATV